MPRTSPCTAAPPVLIALALVAGVAARAGASWTFTDVTTDAGLVYQHGYPVPAATMPELFSAGVAAGDYDRDGWCDLYVVRGPIGPNLLFRNRGDGTFEEVGVAAGVAITGAAGSGPTFADYDGDGWLDLLVLGIGTTRPTLFRNRGDGTFADVTAAAGLTFTRNSVSAAFGDFDRDRDLDLFVSHWSNPPVGTPQEHLWRNDGDGTFTDVGVAAGIDLRGDGNSDWTFTPNFVDLDSDGWLDLALASDAKTSQVFRNTGGAFADVTDHGVITDTAGMGAAIADYDNDGDLDWFVTSIWDAADPVFGTGNRLYRNRGDGTLEDATDAAGVRAGDWGWGATFGDFDNDGFVDLFHVNGFGNVNFPQFAAFVADPARLFVSNGDATFTNRAAELGVDHRGRGLGVVAFDYDRDGDLDLFVSNNEAAPVLLRNDGGNAANHLAVRLHGLAPNTEGIGARITVTAGGTTQIRELRAGSNYVSQNPAEAHFGLGPHAVADRVAVRWQTGGTTVLTGVAANQRLEVTQTVAGRCGDGVVDVLPGYVEECDEGAANGTPASCCLVNCAPRPAPHECRASAGPCDPAEHCDGVAGACPADAKSTAECRAAVDLCDVAEACDGASPVCPPDAIAPAAAVCRPAAGPCDLAEACSGTATACPADGLAPGGTVCRPASGLCDVAEQCAGTSAACPPDAFAPATTVCRAAAGPCDVGETCSGTGAACPADAKVASGTVCRAAAGACDVAEACDGAGAACPPDALAPPTTVCRAAAGDCDLAETCPGTAPDCPADAKRPSASPCTSDGNPCTDDLCDGAGTCAHPPNAAVCDDGRVCTQADACQGGVCTGVAVACDDANPCTADRCDEGAGGCVAEVVADGTPCDDGDPSTTADACAAGACAGAANVDRYVCNRAKVDVRAGGQKLGSPLPERVLADRFDSGRCYLKGEQHLCTPADPALHAGVHQVDYRLVCPTRFAPTSVRVDDGLGPAPVEVTLTKRIGMLAPASALDLGPTPPAPPQAVPAPPPGDAVDRYTCYKVRGFRFRPSLAVTVPDGTPEETILLLDRMTRVCTPASVDGHDPTAPGHASQLVCYKAKPPRRSRSARSVVSAFCLGLGPQVLGVRSTRELCVPAALVP